VSFIGKENFIKKINILGNSNNLSSYFKCDTSQILFT